MVCTSHPLASQIGLDILKQGGNAIDAAIAANAALGLLEPTGGGVQRMEIAIATQHWPILREPSLEKVAKDFTKVKSPKRSSNLSKNKADFYH
jgi:hypothetical protein